MEEIYIVDDLSDGSIKVVRAENLVKLKRGNFIISHKIVGRNMEIQAWGTSANVDLFSQINKKEAKQNG